MECGCTFSGKAAGVSSRKCPRLPVGYYTLTLGSVNALSSVQPFLKGNRFLDQVKKEAHSVETPLKHGSRGEIGATVESP